MRKRLVIAAIAVVAVGVAVYVLLQPKKGSLEWHKRKYVAASEAQLQRSFLERAGNKVADVTTLDGLRPNPQRYEEAFQKHAAELIRLGFLDRRRLLLDNAPSAALADAVIPPGIKLIPHERARFVHFQFGDFNGSNVVEILAPREDIQMWEDLTKKADAQQSGK